MSATSVDGAGRERLVLKWIRGREEEMAHVVAELVAMRSENPPGKHYGGVTKVLQKHIRKFGFNLTRFQPKSKRRMSKGQNANESPACLLAEYGRGTRTLYFHGHYDVVPAQSAEQFKPARKKHFLFGRGSCDMKGGIVAMLYAMRALKECGVSLEGKIGLMLVPDEETGGARGSAWLARDGLLGRNGIGMLTAEPTSGVVWNANRGAISLRVEVCGKSAHVGLQHRGENAFERMHRVVERLLALKREVEQRTTMHQIGGETMHQIGGEPESKDAVDHGALRARHSILMVGGQSGGGSNFNAVPEKCWFTVDRRINPEENLEDEKARLIGVLQECQREGIPLTWEIFQEAPSAGSGADEKLGVALAASIEKITGNAPRFEMCPGLLETRFYAAKDVPAYAYGPGLLSVAHGPKEYVDMRRVIGCATIYAFTAMEILRP